MLGRSSSAISPTAHYTGEVWRRHGLSAAQLGTWQGRLLHTSVQPLMLLSRGLGGDTLEDFLLARHRIIDDVLIEAIESGRIGQVIEIAAGMSPRGLRMSDRFPDLDYVEADLAAMAARKRAALERAGAHHRVVELDAFAAAGPASLGEVAAGLSTDRGLAIVSEGLLNYFPRDDVAGLWERIGETLSGFSAGLYVSDVILAAQAAGGVQRAVGAAIGAFVRGRIHYPFEDEADAAAALRRIGYGGVSIHRGSEGSSARGAERVHVIEAWTG
jgi:O-methyltransferase involved in polyketide biosynthesis